MGAVAQYRRAAPDGRIVVVFPELGDHSWYAGVEGEDGSEGIGWPLASLVAETLGYQVAHEEWPAWIDAWAAEIVRDARARGFAAIHDPRPDPTTAIALRVR